MLLADYLLRPPKQVATTTALFLVFAPWRPAEAFTLGHRPGQPRLGPFTPPVALHSGHPTGYRQEKI